VAKSTKIVMDMVWFKTEMAKARKKEINRNKRNI
jgi:hypothetical protein